MNKGYFVALATLTSLNLVACQPMAVPTTAAPGQAQSLKAGANVNVRISMAKLGIKALPGNYRFDHYKVTLVANDGTTAVPGVTPQTLSTMSGSVTLSAVPAGTGYKIRVNAFGDVGETITLLESAPGVAAPTGIPSTDTVDVAGGVATYSNVPLAAVGCAVTFAQATAETNGTKPLTLNFAGVTGAINGGIILYNNANYRAKANGAASATTTYQLANVQEGAHAAASHTIWAYAGNGTDASVAKPTPFTDSTAGTGIITNGALAVTLVNPAAVPLTVTAVPDAMGMKADGAGNFYYYSGGSFYKDGAGTAANAVAGVTGFAVAANGTLFYSNAAGKIFKTTDAGATSTPVVDFSASVLAVLTNKAVQNMAIDAFGNLYWYDGTGKILTMPSTGTLTDADISDTTLVPAGITGLAVDGFGNVYMSSATDVFKALRNDNETGFAAFGGTLLTGTISSIAVDPAGDLYVNDSGTVKMLPVGHAFRNVLAAPAAGTYPLASGADGSLYIQDGAATAKKL